MLYPVSGIYSGDNPQFWEITMDVASITVTVLKVENCSNTVTIPGKDLNINIDCLASSDRLEYN